MVQPSSSDNHTYKLIQWGTGAEVLPQLFDLTADPDEFVNLLNTTTTSASGAPLLPPGVQAVKDELEQSLRATIDYPTVAQEVAQYVCRLVALHTLLRIAGYYHSCIIISS